MIQRSNGKKYPKNPAGSKSQVGKPHSWDKATSCAYLRLVGLSQEKAAEAAGVGVRTLRAWEVSPFWPEAQAEASSRWLDGLRGKAMVGLETGVLKDGRLAFDVLSRMMTELAPGALKIDLTGDLTLHAESAREQIRNRIRRLQSLTN